MSEPSQNATTGMSLRPSIHFLPAFEVFYTYTLFVSFNVHLGEEKLCIRCKVVCTPTNTSKRQLSLAEPKCTACAQQATAEKIQKEREAAAERFKQLQPQREEEQRKRQEEEKKRIEEEKKARAEAKAAARLEEENRKKEAAEQALKAQQEKKAEAEARRQAQEEKAAQEKARLEEEKKKKEEERAKHEAKIKEEAEAKRQQKAQAKAAKKAERKKLKEQQQLQQAEVKVEETPVVVEQEAAPSPKEEKKAPIVLPEVAPEKPAPLEALLKFEQKEGTNYFFFNFSSPCPRTQDLCHVWCRRQCREHEQAPTHPSLHFQVYLLFRDVGRGQESFRETNCRVQFVPKARRSTSSLRGRGEGSPRGQSPKISTTSGVASRSGRQG
jgi:hypothetical protein